EHGFSRARKALWGASSDLPKARAQQSEARLEKIRHQLPLLASPVAANRKSHRTVALCLWYVWRGHVPWPQRGGAGIPGSPTRARFLRLWGWMYAWGKARSSIGFSR